MNITLVGFGRFILFFAIITPLLPKIKIIDGVYIYAVEILLGIFFPFFIYKLHWITTFSAQRWLIIFWFFIILSSIVSLFYSFDLTGIFKSIKYLLYVPLIYISFNYFNEKNNDAIKFMIYVGIIAMVMNIISYIYSYYTYGASNWDIRNLSSGFSNKYIDPIIGKFGIIPSGSHGVWGNYCVLLFALGIHARMLKLIHWPPFYLLAGLVFLSLSISVSREALLVFFVLGFGLTINTIKKNFILRKRFFIWIILGIALIIPVLVLFNEKLGMVEKLFYTINSLMTSGREANINMRFNVWALIFIAFINFPFNFLIGFGYNPTYFKEILYIGSEQLSIHHYPSVPESFYVMAISYGGLGALVASVFFSIRLIQATSINHVSYRLIRFYLYGVLFVNLIASASLVSDLLYGQILIVLGYLYYRKNEELNESIND